MRRVLARLRSLVLHRRLERDMHEEMRQHLEQATERLVARGLPRDAARREALKEFGNVHYLQEQARDVRGFRWLGALTLDGKLALRMLVKDPLLNVVAGVGLAVGVALATGFTVFLTFYYSAVPVEEGDRVVTVEYVDGGDTRSTLFDYRLWKDELASIDDVAAYRTGERELASTTTAARRAEVAEMTASAFRQARVPPLLGRPILDSDEVEGAPPVAVLGHQEWQRWFGGDPGVVGRAVRIDGSAHVIVGVMPEGLRLPVNHGVWTALATGAAPGGPTGPTGPAGSPEVRVFGRLAPGIGAGAAEAEVTAMGARLVAEHPDVYERPRGAVVPYIRHLFSLQHEGPWVIWLTQLFAALMLVAVAVNVGVLFYARTARRWGEITVRTALGASRSRILTQLFLEALALSAVAAALGLVIAQAGYARLQQVEAFREELPYWLFGGLPAATVAYAAGLAVLVAVFVGVLPGLQATRRHIERSLRTLSGGTGLRMGRTWSVLICVQVAVAVGVLPAVVAVGWNYSWPTPTFPASEVLAFSIEPPPGTPGAADSDATPIDYFALQTELLRRVEAMPEVAGVTFASAASWLRDAADVQIEVDGATAVSGTLSRTRSVGAEYFDVIGGSLLAGRTFERADAVEGATAAVVSRAFVNEYLAGGPAPGRRFREVQPGEGEEAVRGPWFEVVGVVENELRVRGGQASPQVYHPIPLGARPLALLARTMGTDAAASLAPRVRAVADDVAPDLELSSFPLAADYYGDTSELRLLLLAVALITLSVLVLSAAGISAMMSFAVTQRYREIGIRTALGASRRKVVASIFARSARQLGTGLLVGVAVAAVVDRFAGGDMMGGDAPTLLALVAALMLLSGLLATVGPTRRALRIQPMEALREE